MEVYILKNKRIYESVGRDRLEQLRQLKIDLDHRSVGADSRKLMEDEIERRMELLLPANLFS